MAVQSTLVSIFTVFELVESNKMKDIILLVRLTQGIFGNDAFHHISFMSSSQQPHHHPIQQPYVV